MAAAAPILFITMVGIGAGASILGGIAANNAAQAEADRLEQQGRIAQQESLEEAQRKADENRKFSKVQKLAFLKNGVTLEGSPLLVLDETLDEGQKEVDAEVRRGNAQATLHNQKAAQTRNEGRAQLLGGFAGAAGTVGSATIQGRQAGLF
jgi:hypothetical protein